MADISAVCESKTCENVPHGDLKAAAASKLLTPTEGLTEGGGCSICLHSLNFAVICFAVSTAMKINHNDNVTPARKLFCNSIDCSSDPTLASYC